MYSKSYGTYFFEWCLMSIDLERINLLFFLSYKCFRSQWKSYNRFTINLLSAIAKAKDYSRNEYIPEVPIAFMCPNTISFFPLIWERYFSTSCKVCRMGTSRNITSLKHDCYFCIEETGFMITSDEVDNRKLKMIHSYKVEFHIKYLGF